MIRALFAAALFLLGLGQPAQAQSWIQFSTCGVPPRTLTPGSPATIGVDLTGNLCISGSISVVLRSRNAKCSRRSEVSRERLPQ